MATGIGTQDDPYIVDSWKDYLSVASTTTSSPKYITFNGNATSKSINFDVEYPDGCDGILFYDYIDFNSWTLSNFSFKPSNNVCFSIFSGYVRNGHFENINLSSITDAAYLIYFYEAYTNFDILKDCTFSAILSSTRRVSILGAGYISGSDRNGSVDSCTFVCELYGSETGPAYAPNNNNQSIAYITNSLLDIRCQTLSGWFFIYYGVCTIMNGNLLKLRIDDINLNSGKTGDDHYSRQATQNFIVLYDNNATLEKHTDVLKFARNFLSPGYFVAVSEGSKNWSIASSSENFVTSDDMKNANYLKGIGFAIGGE